MAPPGNSYACNSEAPDKHPIGCLVESRIQEGKDFSMIKRNQYRAVLFCGVTLLFAGCSKQDDSKANYQTAINNYYKAHPVCLWRSTWTPDSSQPGYGNFCYGNRAVDSIDSFTAGVNGSGLKTAEVNYHYSLSGVPGWAKTQEIKTAFPSVAAALAQSQPAHDSLVMNGASWQVVK
jgi:hypothetical protein